MKQGTYKFENRDCMLGMQEYPDKYFDLAIVDPPYGIRIAKWDTKPKETYFNELTRISLEQIIWGGNYFDLPQTEGWICWHKTYNYGNGGFSGMSDFELAWTSFLKKAKYFPYQYIGNCIGGKPNYSFTRIHPTEKPIALYKWLLSKYAKEGDKILDTHVGSASSIIVCIDMGFSVVGYELDKDYFDMASKRIDDFLNQQILTLNDNIVEREIQEVISL